MAMLAPLLPTGMRLAYGMLRNSHEAEDAVQDAAFKAWRSAARFRRDADPRPWFLTIVANECRQRLRSRWWSVSKVTDMPQASGFGSEVDEEAADLRSALRRLPADMRLVLVLRYYLDLPFDKIARTLKCSPQAAKSRTHRALQRLRVEVPKELDT
jgi:RNA polymerase sigma-70 factor (ECF subfamily)